jgi:hypothetical protein
MSFCEHQRRRLNYLVKQCRRGGEWKGWEAGAKLPTLRCPEGGPEPNYVAPFFVFRGNIIICRWHKLTFSDQAQVPFSVTIFSWFAVSGAPEKFFYLGLDSHSAALLLRLATCVQNFENAYVRFF